MKSSKCRLSCLFLQTNHQKSTRRRSSLQFICFLLFIFINQTTQTYTNTFIDHKTLLSPTKQLITNTLKQIKPKFNPRYPAAVIRKPLNVYDLSAGDVKGSVSKHHSKEQLPQSTYYYTDYKPSVNLVPMSPHCPETGRTVCKEAKSYPSESILNLILEAKSNNFNFSSLFVDESQNESQPQLPELEKTIAKLCGSDDDTKDYEDKKDEKKYPTKSTKITKTPPTTTTTTTTKTKSDVDRKETNYKRPTESTVNYDNNGDNYHYSSPNKEKYDNQDRYEQQRIMNNENIFNNEVKNTDSQQQLVVNHPTKNYLLDNNQLGGTKLIYPQPQSSIKFERQQQQYPNKQTPLNRKLPTYISSRPIKQQSGYRRSPNVYYQTNNGPRKNSARPYQTHVTIIPFIQYITRIPTDDYRLRNANKQLLDTFSQSLRHTPLNDYSPDAWLPIKTFTTTDLQDRMIDDHLSSDELTAAAGFTPPNYSRNYRDKRSTKCLENQTSVVEKSKSNNSTITEKSNRTKSNRKETNVDLNKNDEKIKKKEERTLENSSITRVKKQAGFDEEPEELCQTKRLFIMPKAALNDKSEWRYIVNVGERDSRLKQVIKVDVCASPNGACSSTISLPFGYISKCKQKYIKKKLLAIDPDGQSTSTESFFIPSCCVCEIVRMNQK